MCQVGCSLVPTRLLGQPPSLPCMVMPDQVHCWPGPSPPLAAQQHSLDASHIQVQYFQGPCSACCTCTVGCTAASAATLISSEGVFSHACLHKWTALVEASSHADIGALDIKTPRPELLFKLSLLCVQV